MAVKNNTRTRKPAKPAYKSKSAEAVALMKGEDPEFIGSPQSVSAVEKIMTARGRPMGYAFIYGRAKAAGLNLTAAKRRATRAISKDDKGIVTVQTAEGPVVIHPDGLVTGGHRPAARSKSKAPQA